MLNSSRVQIFISILVILTLLSTLACGGKGQEIRDMTAEKLQGVAEKLADEGTATPASSPMPESIPNDVSPVTSLPTAPPTTMPASVPTVEPTPTSPTISAADAPIPTPTVTSPSATAILASIKVEPQSAEPGEWVTITGTELPPLTTISSFTLGGISVLPPFPIATEASGEFTTGVLMPSLPNGVHIVVLTVGSTSTAATFTVTGST